MKLLINRVSQAKVFVGERIFSSISEGIVLFVGIENKDNSSLLEKVAEKVVNLRIFPDDKGKLNYSLKDKNYSLLCIPNFSLCASVEKGRRPSFENALRSEKAQKIFEELLLILRAKGIGVEEGVFRERMRIEVSLDGPLNIAFSLP